MDVALKDNKTVPFIWHFEGDTTTFYGAFRLCIADEKSTVLPKSPSMKLSIAFQMSTLFKDAIKQLYNHIIEKDFDSAGILVEASFIHSSGSKFVEQLFIWLNRNVRDEEGNLFDASQEGYPWYSHMPVLKIEFETTMEQVKKDYIEFDTDRRE